MGKQSTHPYARKALNDLICIWNHTPKGRTLVTRRYKIVSGRLAPEMSGLRILQISDVHGRMFGEDDCRLEKLAASLAPDLILVTGDVINHHYLPGEKQTARALYRVCARIAPTYAILGNHETNSVALDRFLDDITDSPVRLLRNESVNLERGADGRITETSVGRGIRLMGIDTGPFTSLHQITEDTDGVSEKLDGLLALDGSHPPYTILMGHKPELLPWYARPGVDLVFSGHAHGGLMQLWGGKTGLLCPGQGWFPKITKGIYSCRQTVNGELTDRHTVEIVSCGLGGPRWGVSPELVFTVLERKPDGGETSE